MLLFSICAAIITTTQKNPSWALDRIDQMEGLNNKFIYPNNAGTGVVVYVLDSGINANDPEFQGRVQFGINLTNEPNGDYSGHGTFVAGIIGSKTYGAAKSVLMIDVKVSDANGEYSEDVLLDALEWFATMLNDTKNRLLLI